MRVEDKDLIFNQDLSQNYLKGDKVIANGVEFTITEFKDSKLIKDQLGFPVNYSWYKAEDSSGKLVNIFFFDEDIDSVESNDKVAEEWFKSVYNKSVNI